MFVLDEADEMLSRGFKDQIYEIFQKLSTNIQVNWAVFQCEIAIYKYSGERSRKFPNAGSFPSS